jgi:hypothetical protein
MDIAAIIIAGRWLILIKSHAASGGGLQFSIIIGADSLDLSGIGRVQHDLERLDFQRLGNGGQMVAVESYVSVDQIICDSVSPSGFALKPFVALLLGGKMFFQKPFGCLFLSHVPTLNPCPNRCGSFMGEIIG